MEAVIGIPAARVRILLIPGGGLVEHAQQRHCGPVSLQVCLFAHRTLDMYPMFQPFPKSETCYCVVTVNGHRTYLKSCS